MRNVASSYPLRTSAFRAFTLIELLTVIAIIGILAAILVPTVGSVRRKAASTKSLANVKQFGAAYFAFAADNKNKLPPAGALTNGSFDAELTFGLGANNKGWDYFLFPYIFPDNGDGNMPQNAENLMMHPNDERTNPAGETGSRRTYAANTGATPLNTITLMSQLQSPSRLILLSERPCGGGTIGGYAFADLTPTLQVRDIPAGFELNPGDKFNYLFADGHVSTLSLPETMLPGQNVSSGGGKSYNGTGTYDLWRNP